jgi:hypothetical protein
MPPPNDTLPPLNQQGITRLQHIVGTMLVALGTIAAAQTQETVKTMAAMVHLLDHAASNPNAAVRFRRSNMVLTPTVMHPTHTSQEAVYICAVLTHTSHHHRLHMHHHDNSTASGFTNPQHPLRHSESMDMHFQWVPDHVKQGALTIDWQPGDANRGN